MTNLIVTFHEFLLDMCKKEYQQKLDIMARIETKAQNTIGLSGIFLAAAVAFIDSKKLKDLLILNTSGTSADFQPQILILGIGLICLLAAIIFCLIAMGVRSFLPPMTAENVERIVDQVSEVEPAALSDEIHIGFLQMNITKWKEAIQLLSSHNKSKALSVMTGQFFLVSAIILFTVFLLQIIWKIAT